MVRPRPCWILSRVVPLSDTRHSTKWPAGHNSPSNGKAQLSEILGCIDIRLMFRHLKGSMDIGVAMQTFANVSENGFDVAAAGACRRKRNGVDRGCQFIVNPMRQFLHQKRSLGKRVLASWLQAGLLFVQVSNLPPPSHFHSTPQRIDLPCRGAPADRDVAQVLHGTRTIDVRQHRLIEFAPPGSSRRGENAGVR